MAGDDIAQRRRNERAVIQFVKQQKGVIFVVSEDGMFLRVLRSTIQRHLSLAGDHIVQLTHERGMLDTVLETLDKGVPALLFVERVFRGKKSYSFIKKVKEHGSQAKVLVVTGPAGPESLIMCYEMGADNLVYKPVSVNTLLDKAAGALNPPSKTERLIEAGTQLVEAGDLEKAAGLALYLLKQNPRSASAFVLLGDAYRALGDKERALQAFERASEQSGMFLKPLQRLAGLHTEDGDLETGLSYLEKLDSINPLNMDRKVDMGGLHVELGHADEAEKLFETAVSGASEEMLNYVEEISTRIAETYESVDPQRAEKYYRRALEARGSRLDLSDIVTFNRLGLSLRRQGKWKEAVAEYKKAMRIAPKDENLAYNLAMALAEGGQHFEASEQIYRVLEINPEFYRKDPVVCYNIGVIFTKIEDADTARRFLELATQLDPDFAKPRELLQTLAAA